VLTQLDLFTTPQPARFPFRGLVQMENASMTRIRYLEAHGKPTEAADEFSAVTMRRLEVARVNGWSPIQREIGRARNIGGFQR
jgi:hypothetical protein